jgi:hypothetical protein
MKVLIFWRYNVLECIALLEVLSDICPKQT